MAMLAERRQKKRYHLTPKGKPLFDDNDRFGTKMLEKMGWSKGKGLGKSEDGGQDFIRVRFKSDERGLGFEERDDQWTEHDKNFNGLLENLNGGSNACPDDCEIITPTVGLGFATKSSKKKKLKDSISGQSLEENSKKSKARVHYKKFTKGKDMSQYSEKDLANIFGKKATPEDANIYSQFQAFNAAGSENDEKKEAKEECVQEPSSENPPPIINAGVSINDYFKAKMAALKEKQGSASSNPFARCIRIVNNIEVVVPSAKRKRSTDEELLEANEVPRKKKKTKSLEAEDSDSVNQTKESGEIEVHVPRKKKKTIKQSIVGEECDFVTKTEQLETVVLEDITEEAPKKKKKSKKLTAIEDEKVDESKQPKSEPDVDGDINKNHPESNSEESNSSKKKKSKKVPVPEENIVNDINEETARIQPQEEIPKKKKKKVKKETADDTDSNNKDSSSSAQESTTHNIEEENIKPIPKKIKNKTINSTRTAEAEVSSHQLDLTPLTNTKNYLVDTYTISTFCAEKFRNIELHQYQGSNLMDLNGYGLSENLELDIQKISNDAERIMRLWSGTLDKYTHSTSTQKMYASYLQKVKQARKSKKKIPELKFKSLKRQHVFQCI